MPKTTASLGFEHKGIAAALMGTRLAVPLNQREYSWASEHIEDLFQDIADAIQTNKQHYFLGTIVLMSRTVPEVVDGQQRLATTTILLAAMRDFLISRKEELLYQSIENDFLFTVDRDNREQVPRLTLNVNDRTYFLNRVLRRPDDSRRVEAAKVTDVQKKPSHVKIDRACQMAAERIGLIVAGHAESRHIDRINQWLSYLEKQASVIVLTVPDDLNAYKMFETLNDRGLKTTQADLLKNFLFGEAEESLPEAQSLWSRMTTALEPIDDEEIVLTYLRHLTSAVHGATREKDIFEKLHKTISGRHAAIEFLEYLASFADDYAALLNPGFHKKWNDYPPQVRDQLSVLRELRVVQMRPLMLAVARQFDPKEAAVAFRAFVSWAVRFLIVGGGGGGVLDRAYADAAQAVVKGQAKTTKDIHGKIGALIPTDAQFKAAFETAAVSQAFLARYYLRALEARRRNESNTPELVPVTDTTVVNLEHVLPKSPTPESWPDIDAETATAYARRLGNMVLMTAKSNNVIGNAAFADKKPVLAASTIELTAEVANSSKWGIAEINERQRSLADLALATWPMGA